MIQRLAHWSSAEAAVCRLICLRIPRSEFIQFTTEDAAENDP
jgi:hypothetical protein